MSSAFSKTALILGYRGRAAGRALSRHAFAATVLAPMIIVGSWFVLEPVFERVAQYLDNAAASWSQGDLLATAGAAAIALLVFGIPSTVQALFGLRSPDQYLDALPVPSQARFHAALLTTLARAAVLWTVALALLAVAARTAGVAIPDDVWATAAAAWVETALAQLVVALVLAKLRLLRGLRMALPALVALGLVVALRFEPAAVAGLAPLAGMIGFWQAALGAALSIEPGLAALNGWLLHAAAIAILYPLALWLYGAWRDELREAVEQATARKRRLLAAAAPLLAFRVGRPLAAQVLRDLRLTLRVFSPVVFVAGGGALLCLAFAARALATDLVPAVWTGPLLLVCEGLACLCLAALAPILLQQQLPGLWAERAIGVKAEDLANAKARYALWAACPAMLGALALSSRLDLEPLLWGFFAVRIVLVWIAASTVIGILSIDIAPSPVIGLLLCGAFAMALCGMYMLDDFWPLGLMFYAYVMPYLRERAEAAAEHLGVEA